MLQTLVWLQQKYDFKVQDVSDAAGNNLLHQVAKSSYAARFIRKLAVQDVRSENLYLDIWGRNIISECKLVQSTNSKGQTWLDVLVEHGNAEGLDIALSLHYGLFWQLRFTIYFGRDGIASLQKNARESNDYIIQQIVDTFVHNIKIMHIHGSIWNCIDSSEDDLLAKDEMLPLRSDGAKWMAEYFMRFLHDWGDHDEVEHNIMSVVVKRGFSRLFKLFYDADSSWFWIGEYLVRPYSGNNEFIQVRFIILSS